MCAYVGAEVRKSCASEDLLQLLREYLPRFTYKIGFGTDETSPPK